MASACDSCRDFDFEACVHKCAGCPDFDKGCKACPKDKGCLEPARVDDLGADE